MNRFLTQLPVVIASLSLALIKTIADPLKWLGSFYYHIETAILGTLADISLAILSFRYVFLLLLIGGGLAYVQWWWALAGYVLIILIAVVRMLQLGTQPPTPEEEQAHQELRDNSIKFLRLPLRILAMLVSLYFSWQFVDVKSFNQIAEAKTNSQQAAQTTDKTEVADKTTISDEVKSFFGNTELDEPIEMNFEFKKFRQKVCGLPNGKHVIKADQTSFWFIGQNSNIPDENGKEFQLDHILGGSGAEDVKTLPYENNNPYYFAILFNGQPSGSEVMIKEGCVKVSFNIPRNYEQYYNFDIGSKNPSKKNTVFITVK
jgi:hypothetical protein